MKEFDQGMADSFAPELTAMGEEIEANGKTAQAVVDAVTTSIALNGARITSNSLFDIYIMAEFKEKLELEDGEKVTLNDRPDKPTGRVMSMAPIEGGQFKVIIGPRSRR